MCTVDHDVSLTYFYDITNRTRCRPNGT